MLHEALNDLNQNEYEKIFEDLNNVFDKKTEGKKRKKRSKSTNFNSDSNDLMNSDIFESKNLTERISDVELDDYDYLLINNPDIDAKYKIALLLNNIEKYKMAIGYCNDIINNDERSYFGFSCVADTYFKAGRGLSAVRAFDLLIDRDPGKARYYIERALYRKALGDTIGYNQDVDKAKSISPSVDTNLSLVDETLRPKRVKINCL